MRATIVVEPDSSIPSSFVVGPPAVLVLEGLPGISDVRLESQGARRATISYQWRDPGVHSAGIDAALLGHGMRLV